MKHPASRWTKVRMFLQRRMDNLETSLRRANAAAFWVGIGAVVIGAGMTYLHGRYVDTSFTELLILRVGNLIKRAHSMLPWSAADLCTYLGAVLLLVSLALWIVRRLNRRGIVGFLKGGIY